MAHDFEGAASLPQSTLAALKCIISILYEPHSFVIDCESSPKKHLL